MKKQPKAKDFNLEKAMARIEEIVDRMESGDVELDQALGLYEEGMALMAKCQQVLNDTQKRIQKLTRDGQGRLTTEELDLEEEQDG